jgi:hypothetical protein
MERQLTPGVKITVLDNGVVPLRLNGNDFRVIVNFMSDVPDKNRLIKEYFIWLDERKVIASLGLDKDEVAKQGLDNAEIAKAAMNVAQENYEANGNNTPSNDGIFCTPAGSEEKIYDAKNFVHPVEKS